METRLGAAEGRGSADQPNCEVGPPRLGEAGKFKGGIGGNCRAMEADGDSGIGRTVGTAGFGAAGGTNGMGGFGATGGIDGKNGLGDAGGIEGIGGLGACLSAGKLGDGTDRA